MNKERTIKDITLLIVDDENDLCEVISHDFRRRGFNVLTASSGNEAFELVEKNKIDLILSDIQMPNGTGVDMLAKIKAKYPGLPIVMFITGFSNHAEADLLGKGATAVFAKPFNREKVYQAVMKAVGLN